MVNAQRVATERSKLLLNAVHPVRETPTTTPSKESHVPPRLGHAPPSTFNRSTEALPDVATDYSEGENEPEPRLTWKPAGWHCFIGQRLIFTQDLLSLSMTVAFCLALLVVYFIGVFPNVPIELTGVGLALFFLVFVFLTLTVRTDPGILPRQNEPDPRYFGVPSHIGTDFKYCEACALYRPPRAKHCRFCDHCVQRFDHHCPWVGSCIAERNYRWFMCFLVAGTACTLYYLVVAMYQLIHDVQERELPFFHGLFRYPFSVMLIVGSGVAFCGLFGLLAYHIMLLVTGQTTNEHVRDTYPDKNPFDKGWRGNVSESCCTPIPPSLLTSENYQKRLVRSAIVFT